MYLNWSDEGPILKLFSVAPLQLPEEPLDTEFKQKYPPDRLGEEMKPNARVWKVYRDEANAHDAALLDGWGKTLDILLIFVSPDFHSILHNANTS